MSFERITGLFGISVADNATAEDIKSAFNDADVSAVIPAADYNKLKGEYDKLKTSFDTTSSDLSAAKKRVKALESAVKAEPTEADLRVAELERKLMARDLTESWMDLGYGKADAASMAEGMLNLEDTTAFFKLAGKRHEAIRKEHAKQRLLDTPAPKGGAETGEGRTTPDDFRKMTPAEKQNLLHSNPEAFNALKSGQSVDLSGE